MTQGNLPFYLLPQKGAAPKLADRLCKAAMQPAALAFRHQTCGLSATIRAIQKEASEKERLAENRNPARLPRLPLQAGLWGAVSLPPGLGSGSGLRAPCAAAALTASGLSSLQD